MTVSGRVRETKVFGDKLELTRSVTTSLGASKLVIRDTVENIGFNDSPLMMLYHVNIGLADCIGKFPVNFTDNRSQTCR